MVTKLHTHSRRKQEFPRLTAFNHWVKSPQTRLYNCFAWAMGDDTRQWRPDPFGQHYWPPKARRVLSIDAFTEMLALFGFSPTASRVFEKGVDKLALYSLNASPTHLAKQLPKGKWTSKLGDVEDVEHTLDALEGPAYGTVVQIYARRQPKIP
ncbi:MAG: hypothetical protein WBO23_16675 [Burkholderiales bacterium]